MKGEYVVAVSLAVALATIAVVFSLLAVRNTLNANSSGSGGGGGANNAHVLINPNVHTPNAVPGTPSAYPPVRASDRVLDVRVHRASPSPPMHPFAIATGQPFEQVGIVYNLETDSRHPLFAREAPYRRHRYQYYVSTDNSSIQISARSRGRDCGEELGCDELYTDDTISVPELSDKEFKVKLFSR